MPRKRPPRIESSGQIAMPYRPEEPESSVQASILRVLNMLGDVEAHRNNTGVHRAGRRYIPYGLGGKGGTDIIAFVRVRGFAVVGAIETKRHGKDATDDQRKWMRERERYGVITGTCTTVQQALALIDEARKRARA